MSRLTESAIEGCAIKLFERLGYSYVYASDIAPDGEYPAAGIYGEVIQAVLNAGYIWLAVVAVAVAVLFSLVGELPSV